MPWQTHHKHAAPGKVCMIETHPSPKAKRSDTLRLLCVIFLLLAALTAVLAVSGGIQAQQSNRPLAVSLLSGPRAYCAFPLLEDKNSRYQVSLEDGFDGVLSALQAGTPDAALIPAAFLPSVDAKKYTAAAVTAHMNLVAVQNGGSAAGLLDLNGKSVVMPSSLKDAPEYGMLRFLLDKTNVSPEIAFQSGPDIWERIQSGDFDILLLPVDRCAAALMQNSGYRSCFNLAREWTALLGTAPPAGDVLLIRADSLANSPASASALVSSLRTGIDYANAKHKKAAQLIKGCGLGTDTVFIYKTLPHCMFACLEGEAMNAALQQLFLLTEKP